MMFGGVAAVANEASRSRTSEQRSFMGSEKRAVRGFLPVILRFSQGTGPASVVSDATMRRRTAHVATRGRWMKVAPMPTPLAKCISQDRINALQLHVSQMWQRLTRSTRDALEAAQDSKLETPEGERWPLYVSAGERVKMVRERLRRTLDAGSFRRLDIRMLSGAPEQITEHGLVYLPGRYVVPGGRFNEMYGWDSYFIAQGLLCEGRTGAWRSRSPAFSFIR
jgi:neutral trehalase